MLPSAARSAPAVRRHQVSDRLGVCGEEEPARVASGLRYLVALLAKEIVLHSYPMPQGGMLLERLVTVLTVAERRLERG